MKCTGSTVYTVPVRVEPSLSVRTTSWPSSACRWEASNRRRQTRQILTVTREPIPSRERGGELTVTGGGGKLEGCGG